MYSFFIKSLNIKFYSMALSVICVLTLLPNSAFAADHGDMPIAYEESLKAAQFNITDVYAFIRKKNLVLVLDTNPRISASTTEYIFPQNVQYNIEIDMGRKGYTNVYTPYANPTKVTESYYNKYGGKIVHPNDVTHRFTLSITFDSNNKIHVTEKVILNTTEGKLTYPLGKTKSAKIFYGLRDDPFIRTPRKGKNVASIVIEYPLKKFTKSSRYLMIWASTRVHNGEEIGLFGDTAGRALRSMFQSALYPICPTCTTCPPVDNNSKVNILNYCEPSVQSKEWSLVPDVMILDTKKPHRRAGLRPIIWPAIRHRVKPTFPNGRELTDDIVKLACVAGGLADVNVTNMCSVYSNEGNYTGYMKNDVPFLKKFPYLAKPHML